MTQVEFAHDGATLVSGAGGSTRCWDVQSGKAKEGEPGEESTRVLEGSMLAFSKGSSREKKVGNFLITAEGDILRIFKSEGGVKGKTDKDTTPVAFFRAPEEYTWNAKGVWFVIQFQVLIRKCSSIVVGKHK